MEFNHLQIKLKLMKANFIGNLVENIKLVLTVFSDIIEWIGIFNLID